jgi:hypothetical protein
MSFPSQDRRADEKLGEKLGLILGRVGSVRMRLNSLAVQHAVFYTLAIVIAASAAIYAGAYLFSPLTFLIFTPLIAIGAALGIVSAIRAGWRMRASAARAAMLADERAELKGRLSTIVALAHNPNHGTLWSYLVEDTLGLKDEFAPRLIERRRISRGIYPLAGAIVLAALALPLSRLRHASPTLPNGDTVSDLTVDLDDLHLRAAEPGDDSGMQVSADPETLRRLQDKLARENPGAGDAEGNSLNQLVNRARDMAGNLQSKLTGQQPPSHQRLNLRLADNGADRQQDQIHRAPDAKKNHRDVAGQFKQDQPHSGNELNLPREDDSRPANKWPSPRSGDNGTELGNGKNNRTDQDAAIDRSIQQGSENGSNGGEGHGIGADPDSLFGAPAASKLGTEGFEIAIEARPIDHGAKGAGHAYVPPKVRTPLNVNQQPDEPVARAAVPAEDRSTIKRVFER